MVLLSILTPSLPERFDLLNELTTALLPQLTPEVEFLVLTDTRQRQCGEKRNELMRMAKGKYLCHIDDDDLLSTDFVKSLLPVCRDDFDVICYDGDATIDGCPPFKVITDVGNPVELVSGKPSGGFFDIHRPPWHWCTWRTELARQFQFPLDYHRNEDWLWLQQITPQVKTHFKVGKVLFHHRFNSKRTTFH